MAAKVSESEAVERLTRLSKELTTILETIHEGALAIDAHGAVIHCNTKAEKLLNLDRTEIVGENLGDFWHDSRERRT